MIREKTSRKRQIVDAAFALTGETDGWTLSEVAGRIGVSKTALYRHFRNKEEIEEAMTGEFRETLLEAIEGQPGSGDFRSRFRAFFRDHEGYLGFFMIRLFARASFDQEVYSFLVSRSGRMAAFNGWLAGAGEERRERIFAGALKTVVSVILASVPEPEIEALQDELMAITGRGLPELTVPTEERLAELDRLAAIRPGEITEETRIFEAIAGSIREHGIAGTTIERIAERMGMAKSSLYFYFPAKADMLDELVKAETSAILGLCEDRAAAGETLAEQLYSVMAVQANYLLAKPDLLPVFNWIRFETLREKHRGTPPDHPGEDFVARFRMGDLFGDDSPMARTRMLAILKWAGILATSAVIQGVRQKESPDRIRRSVRYLFESMLAGDDLAAREMFDRPR